MKIGQQKLIKRHLPSEGLNITLLSRLHSFPRANLFQLYVNHLLHTSVCTEFISCIEYQIEHKAREGDGCKNANQIQDLASNMEQ